MRMLKKSSQSRDGTDTGMRRHELLQLEIERKGDRTRLFCDNDLRIVPECGINAILMG